MQIDFNQCFNQWIKSPKGQAFLSTELEQLEPVYPLLVGSSGLQVSLSDCHDYLQAANLSEQIHILGDNRVVEDDEEPKFKNVVLASSHELPFQKNEFAVVAAPHILELSEQPQATLREIFRVTAPEGLLLITGFNPISLLGLRFKFPFQRSRIKQPLVGLPKLKDWLALLGFEVIAGNYFQYSGLLFDEETHNSFSKRLMKRTHNMLESTGDRWLPAAAGSYVIVARKRVFGCTLVGKKSSKKRRVMVGVKPVTNSVNNLKDIKVKPDE